MAHFGHVLAATDCRTGLEDNVRLDKATLAPSNAALVAQVAQLCEHYGRRRATPAEARRMLGLSSHLDRNAGAPNP